MVRAMLSESLIAVVAQTLLKKPEGGRVAAWEVLVATPAVRNLIRENKIPQMYSVMQTGDEHGMQTMDQCLLDMVEKRIITRDVAREKAKMPENF
jgi:twitching motility protein PilT